MSIKLIINGGIGETRAAFLLESAEAPTRISFACFRDHSPTLLAARFIARVRTVTPELDGAFLDLGGSEAFLPARAARKLKPEVGKNISGLVHEGQLLAVEITRDALHGDSKSAQAKVLVKETHDLPSGCSPGPLDTNEGMIDQLLRWPGMAMPDSIIVDDIDMLAPITARIRSHYGNATIVVEGHRGNESIFDHYGVTERLAGCVNGVIQMPGGGWFSIEETSALTAIDVNSGTAGKGKGAGDAALATNIMAAKMIADEIQFQNIGGLMVIDFIDLADKAAKAKLMAAIKEAFSRDPLHLEYTELSAFGLLELRRQRTGPALSHLLLDAPGILNIETAALGLLRSGLRTALTSGAGSLEISAPENILGWLKMHGPYLETLEKRTARKIELRRAADGLGHAHIKTGS